MNWFYLIELSKVFTCANLLSLYNVLGFTYLNLVSEYKIYINIMKLKSLFVWLNVLISRTTGSNSKNLFVLDSPLIEEGCITSCYSQYKQNSVWNRGDQLVCYKDVNSNQYYFLYDWVINIHIFKNISRVTCNETIVQYLKRGKIFNLCATSPTVIKINPYRNTAQSVYAIQKLYHNTRNLQFTSSLDSYLHSVEV